MSRDTASEGARKQAVASAVAAIALAVSVCAPASGVELNRVVLRVNNRIATSYDFEKLKAERLAALARAEMPDAEKQQRAATVGVAVMKELFDELLVLSRADQLDMRAAEADVQAAIEQTKKNFGIVNEEDFESALAANGMTREQFRDQMVKNILIRQVMSREVYSKIVVEEEDLRRYYQQNPDEFREPAKRRLREVVVLTSSQGAEDLERSAQELRQSILSDEADAVVARWEEDGRSTGWIDLGWVEVGDLDPQLEGALDELEAGDVSVPTPARGGLHVIEVIEKRPAQLRSFKDVSAQIEAALSDQRFEEKLVGYMRDLERNAYIESDPPPEAAGFRSGRAAERRLIDPLESQLAGSSSTVPVEEPAAEGEGAEPVKGDDGNPDDMADPEEKPNPSR
ncbi:MAG: peptidyl-prolyl cis-trans isomerase [Acidobacteriota bacterium]|nr:peptidyl-prolyl cis-trans isomerase [Acidobacteriota bacterium]